MLPDNSKKLLNQPLQEDVAGQAQHYCLSCARHFISDKAMQQHLKTKEHKKRVKKCENEEPYTQAEAERAAGMNS